MSNRQKTNEAANLLAEAAEGVFGHVALGIKCKPGQFVLGLPEEKRALLQSLSSADFARMRPMKWQERKS